MNPAWKEPNCRIEHQGPQPILYSSNSYTKEIQNNVLDLRVVKPAVPVVM